MLSRVWMSVWHQSLRRVWMSVWHQSLRRVWMSVWHQSLMSVWMSVWHQSLMSVWMSVWHQSLMSSIHSLLGLSHLFFPSIIPSYQTPTFTNRLSSILQLWPNALVYCPWSAEQHFFWFQVVALSPHSLFYVANVYAVFSSSTSFQMPAVNLSLFLSVHVSHAYSNTLITHVLIMLSLVFVLICFLFHTVLNPSIAPSSQLHYPSSTHHRAILLLISLLQSLSQASRLARASDSFMTFCTLIFIYIYIIHLHFLGTQTL